MFGKWTAKEKLFRTQSSVARYRANTMNYASFPKSVISSDCKEIIQFVS